MRALDDAVADIRRDARWRTPAADPCGATGNEVTIRNSSLRELVPLAYGVQSVAGRGRGRVAGPPRYDIRALVPVAVDEPEDFDPLAMRGLVNKLLASRFDLEIHVNRQCQDPCGRAAREIDRVK